jgi:transcription termination/antitermination protein NusA
MVVSELRGEKIDIIPYNDEPARFVAKALSPARVREVLVDDETKEATVIVPDDQLSLAIGRDGQNARLAARLTGWKVDIKSETEFSQEEEEIEYEGEEAPDGRCAAVLTTGRRCPNASLEGSHYCGLPQHQALDRFATNQVAVLGPLSDEEVATLAKADADQGEVKTIVERAEGEFDEAQAAAEAESAEEVAEAEEPEEGAEAEPAEDGEEEVEEAEEGGATEEAEEAEEAERAEEAEEPAGEAEEPPPEEPATPEEPAEPEEEAEQAEEPEEEITESSDGSEPELVSEEEEGIVDQQEAASKNSAATQTAGSTEEQGKE